MEESMKIKMPRLSP